MGVLLAADEPGAIEVCAADGPFLVVCEHASNRLPRGLGRLGLAPADLRRHIAFDPGALEVATAIASRLDGTLVIQRYSRLVVDCNRNPELPDAITTLSEDTPIPGNIDLAPDARTRRIAEIWAPFHAAIDDLVSERIAARRPSALVTVHTFTPVYRGVSRPWHVGIISTDQRSLADGMIAGLRRDPALVVGDNEPYSARDNVDYTIRRHGRDRGMPHVMIELRNDLVLHAARQEEWAERLAGVIRGLDVSAVAA